MKIRLEKSIKNSSTDSRKFIKKIVKIRREITENSIKINECSTKRQVKIRFEKSIKIPQKISENSAEN